MANVYLFTGFPGFITTALIKRLVQQDYNAGQINLLVLPSMAPQAREEVTRIARAENIGADKFHILTGDITMPGLGLDPAENARLKDAVTHVFHLAAIYDLATPEAVAYQVNVDGTREVNRWVLTLNNLKRYVYFSTAYVSGTREGRILETDLDKGQAFKNHYEATKFEAEKSARGLLDKVPTTIIRPGIVVGDSRTGETSKFDGPYFILNLFERLKWLPLLPYFGSGQAEANFVPVDYVVDATLHLAHADAGAGNTYHLTDPKPHIIREAYALMMAELLGQQPFGMLPLAAAQAALAIPALRRWLGVEKEALDYFTCQSYYDCAQAQRDLAGSGVQCPDLKDYVKPLIRFYQQHKGDPDKQVIGKFS